MDLVQLSVVKYTMWEVPPTLLTRLRLKSGNLNPKHVVSCPSTSPWRQPDVKPRHGHIRLEEFNFWHHCGSPLWLHCWLVWTSRQVNTYTSWLGIHFFHLGPFFKKKKKRLKCFAWLKVSVLKDTVWTSCLHKAILSCRCGGKGLIVCTEQSE